MVDDQEPDASSEDALASMAWAMLRTAGASIAEILDIPAALKKNVGKALAHLGAIPKALIDAKVADIHARSDARVAITKATGKAMAKGVDVPAELVNMASEREARRILRQQRNLVAVMEVAVGELRKEPYLGEVPVPEISEDWLNAFERHAEDMSSAYMQQLFGKILAGEICNPTSYSMRTVRLLAELDNRAALAFRKLCSLAVVYREEGKVASAQAISVDQEGEYFLDKHGVQFDELVLLEECGLIVPPLPSGLDYADTVRGQEPLEYCGEKFILRPLDQILSSSLHDATFSVRVVVAGVNFSTAGKELYDIVEREGSVDYLLALQENFIRQGISFERM